LPFDGQHPIAVALENSWLLPYLRRMAFLKMGFR
jgi:hypothetical protein